MMSTGQIVMCSAFLANIICTGCYVLYANSFIQQIIDVSFKRCYRSVTHVILKIKILHCMLARCARKHDAARLMTAPLNLTARPPSNKLVIHINQLRTLSYIFRSY
ncbi:unnamed protein product [Euphydryas editha]|uniref:Secreted protein n=1 Tax=Euphydryas editha TaxID=104508 RepID=A0AAU9V5T0_EUPED|nr:unnamed protein product [Euphydryas editha]